MNQTTINKLRSFDESNNYQTTPVVIKEEYTVGSIQFNYDDSTQQNVSDYFKPMLDKQTDTKLSQMESDKFVEYGMAYQNVLTGDISIVKGAKCGTIQ
jgi:hypothetical protein